MGVDISIVCLILFVPYIFCGPCFTDSFLKTIPSNHLYWNLKKPLVIGHLGNVMQFQENTIEGLRSLITIKADGAHMQVQLTKDDKLILFSEDKLLRMTGEDYSVSNLPYSEIQKMNILQTVIYKPTASQEVKRSYRSTPKIPLLTSALDIMKDQNMLLYIEMLSDFIPDGPLGRQISSLTAKHLSNVIQQYQIHKQVFVVSKNPFALKSIKDFDPNIVTGWWLNELGYSPPLTEEFREEYNDLMDSNTCFDNQPNGTLFTKFLLTSGIISKSINASITDFSIPLYMDKKYYQGTDANKELKDIIQDNYGDITLGSFDVFPLNSTNVKATEAEDVKLIEELYEKGVRRFITSDVNRVKTALHEVVTLYSTGVILQHYSFFIILTFLLGKCILSLLYI